MAQLQILKMYKPVLAEDSQQLRFPSIKVWGCAFLLRTPGSFRPLSFAILFFRIIFVSQLALLSVSKVALGPQLAATRNEIVGPDPSAASPSFDWSSVRTLTM